VLSDQQTQVITQGAQKVRPDQASSQTTTTEAPATTIAADGATVVKAVTSAEATVAAVKLETTKPRQSKPEKIVPEKTTETALIITPTTSPDVFVGKKEGKYGILKKDKKTWLIKPEFDRIGSFKVGIADAQKGNKTKYLTRDGHKYDEVGSRDNVVCDRIWAKKDNEYRYLNKNGETPTRFRYDKAGEFSANCTAEVKKDGRTFLIDKNGNELKKGPEVNLKADTK